MKRIIALLMVLCLLLCACGKKQDAEVPTDDTVEENKTQQENEQKKEEVKENTEEKKEEQKQEDKTEVIYRHPLTGEVLTEAWVGQVAAVVMNNIRAAMPQHGLSQADIFYEVEVESDITRCLALFTDFSDVGVIGSIRSARSAFNSIAVSFDAPLIHCGGSPYALAAQYDGSGNTIDNWEHIDETYNTSYFYRDEARQDSGYDFEHTLFSNGELLQEALDDMGYNTPTDKTYGLQFAENVNLNGEKAEQVVITFKGSKTTSFQYDAATGLYTMSQFGDEHTDGNTGEAVSFKNVLAIYTDQWLSPNGVNMLYETITSGEGYAAINGQIVPILWSRESLREPFTYTLADGTPLTLDVGTSYIALVGEKHPISYQ